jgi:hypothetical protein
MADSRGDSSHCDSDTGLPHHNYVIQVADRRIKEQHTCKEIDTRRNKAVVLCAQADAFTGGVARVMLQDAKLAYIDKSGRFIWRER